MTKHLWICVLLMLVGCSSTKVHLYGRYLDASQTEAVTQKLLESGYQVEINQLEFPKTVNTSSVLYSPMLDNYQQLQTLVDELHTINWSISSIQPLVSGNHWYTSDSVGLLLLPPGVDPHNETNALNYIDEYQAEMCEQEVVLTLNKDRSYSLTLESQELDSGQWFLKQFPYLELSSRLNKEWSYYFEVENSQVMDRVSKVSLTKLTPLSTYSVMHNCHFVSGERV